jgi:hypothetical protein
MFGLIDGMTGGGVIWGVGSDGTRGTAATAAPATSLTGDADAGAADRSAAPIAAERVRLAVRDFFMGYLRRRNVLSNNRLPGT